MEQFKELKGMAAAARQATDAARDTLLARWDMVVAQDADLPGVADAQVEGLRAQVSGDLDLSAEDLDDETAALLGWTLPATDTQLDQWHTFVDQCAKEWLARLDR